MIEVVADPNENPTPVTSIPVEAVPDAGEVAPVEQPTVLTPMSAGDFDGRRRRVRYMLAAAILLAVVAAGWIYKRSTDPLRARESYDAGERLFKVARYPQAILSFDRAISLDSDYTAAYLLRARSRMGLADLPHALEDFSTVVRLQPNDPQAYVERGAANLQMGNSQAALADCVKAIELDPKLAAAHNLRGTVVRAKGDARQALEDFTRAVELTPDLDNFYQRGATYQLLGEHKKALADFNEAIQFNPSSAQAYFSRAESKRALGDNEGAKRDHLQGRILDGR